MAKIPFADLQLKENVVAKTFKYQEKTIEVLQYLPFEDKYDLVMITLQNSFENNIYNPIKINMYFHLYLVMMYTNIDFADDDKADLAKLYDKLESNGIIEQVINLVPETEYNQLLSDMTEIMDKELEASKSITSFISNFIADLPKQAKAVQNIVDNFDPNKYQAVLDFAKAANGGRDIN